MKRNCIKVLSFLLVLGSFRSFAQEAQEAKYYGKERKYVDFTSDKVKFNSWSVGVYGGIPIMHSADFRSFTRDKKGIGYDTQLSLSKEITHAFGLQLLGQYGKTKQYSRPNEGGLSDGLYWEANTQYWGVSLLGDLNLTSLLRRVDNKSLYRWGLHAYAGPGLIYYTAKRAASDGTRKAEHKIKPGNTGVSSLFMQGGLGLQYKISRSMDIEWRTMWVHTGDEIFDGSGTGHTDDTTDGYNTANIKPSRYDSFLTTSLGLIFKLGKHPESLKWYDPLQALYPPQKVDLTVCKKGDKDGDGVCDDWDKELDTPAGARVDGSGRALDVDLDGVIDLYDKCVTVPGPASNQGCPIEDKKPPKKEFDKVGKQKIEKVNKELEGIEFDLNKAVVKSKYFPTLNEAAEIMGEYSDTSFDVVGHTDASGAASYNLRLSKQRAQAVKDYLLRKGVASSRLNVIGKGKSDLKYPECDEKSYKTKECSLKNAANRRVEFIPKQIN